jgi:hypothetical protein
MWFTLPLDVIWKHHMGERHWTFLSLVAHTFVMQGAMFFLILLAYPGQLVAPPGQSDYQQVRNAFALYGFILLMWIFGLANLWEIHQRKKAGIQWHSYYRGRPRFLPDKPIINCLIIPLGSGLIAYGCYRLSHPLGIYLFGMAVVQFLDAPDNYHKCEVEKLDRRDREIEMQIKSTEMENSHHAPLDIVRIATPRRRMRTSEQEAQFEARWQKVLKPSGSE